MSCKAMPWSLHKEIVFLMCLNVAWAWKIFVLASPSLIHVIFSLCFQYLFCILRRHWACHTECFQNSTQEDWGLLTVLGSPTSKWLIWLFVLPGSGSKGWTATTWWIFWDLWILLWSFLLGLAGLLTLTKLVGHGLQSFHVQTRNSQIEIASPLEFWSWFL